MKKKMEKKDLLKKLQSLVGDDPEINHGEADDALIEFIGDKDIADAFAKITKWYA